MERNALATVFTMAFCGQGLCQSTDLQFIDRFKTLDPDGWHVAEYDFSHPHFDTDWRKAQVLFGTQDSAAEPGLVLKIQPHVSGSKGKNGYVSGSIRRLAKTGYGTYEAHMKAAAGAGIITGFFTYSGPAYDTRHDEIDVEILGRKPDHLHVAWFVDGVLQNHFIPLGFDATKGFHHYKFVWSEDGITWWVDGEQVFETTRSDGPIPSVPGHVFANVWAADPSIAVWSGKTRPGTATEARFHQISFTPSGLDPQQQ